MDLRHAHFNVAVLRPKRDAGRVSSKALDTQRGGSRLLDRVADLYAVRDSPTAGNSSTRVAGAARLRRNGRSIHLVLA